MRARLWYGVSKKLLVQSCFLLFRSGIEAVFIPWEGQENCTSQGLSLPENGLEWVSIVPTAVEGSARKDAASYVFVSRRVHLRGYRTTEYLITPNNLAPSLQRAGKYAL